MHHADSTTMVHELRDALAHALTLPRHHVRFRTLQSNWPESAKAWLHLTTLKTEQKSQSPQGYGRYFV
jgi:hypothetical protein